MITYILTEQLSENSYGRTYPLSRSISPRNKIFDPKLNSIRYIRCCPGERSVFEDEQSPNAQVSRIVFKNGILTVHEHETYKINYLNMLDSNESNPSRNKSVKAIFRLVDSDLEAKEENEWMEASFEAESIARKMSFEELLDFCRGAGINIDRGAEEIKYDVFYTARNNPEYFLDMYNDPVVKRMSVFRKAEDEGILFFDTNKRQVYMVEQDKKTSVKVVPLGVDMMRHFAEWSFEPEGKEVFTHVNKLLDDDKPKTQTRTRTSRKTT